MKQVDNVRSQHLPTNGTRRHWYPYLPLGLGCLALVLTGCGGTTLQQSATPVATALTGHVHGGQQPVAGAALQLYAAGSGGYGAPATPLLTKVVTSGGDGSFSITGDYTCPANAQVYLVATGGNPGLSPAASNGALSLMAGLGACSALTPSTSIEVNELTTVASVWSLARFMSGYATVGSSMSNSAGLANAFAAIQQLVNTGQGTVPGAALPANATLPSAEINTLADILAACVNSPGGTAGDGSVCGQLFTAATVAGSAAPTDTIGAAVNIARNPAQSMSALFALCSAAGPYQPTLTVAPQNFLIAINYVGGGLNVPSSLAVDAGGNVWVANQGNSTVTELNNTGATLSAPAGIGGGGLNVPSSIALDPSGNVWVANHAGNSVSIFTAAGNPLAASPLMGGGLNAPVSLAIDENGTAWLANSAGNSVSAFSAAGSVLSGANGFTGGGINQPTAIAVNPH